MTRTMQTTTTRATIEPGATDKPIGSKIPGAAALRGNGPHAVSVDGVDLILLRTGGHARVHVYQGRCPHQGALLGEGELDGDAWCAATTAGASTPRPESARAARSVSSPARPSSRTARFWSI